MTTDRIPRRFAIPALLILALALALRVAGGRGDLFLDEIWSFRLLRPLTAPWQILALHHDNNHYLNSLWLYAWGPDAPVFAVRFLSILLGVLGVAAAGWWNARRDAAAALAGMALLAVAYAGVHYGSEARGYAGLILFTILAFALTERLLQGKGGRWRLAFAAVLGIASHLAMVLALGVIAMWCAIVEARRQPHLVRAATATFALLWPAALASLPLVVPVALSMRARSFAIGMLNPFSASDFIKSYGLLIRSLTGVPGLEYAPLYLILPVLALALGWLCRAGLGSRIWLYAIAIAVMPAALFALRAGNTDQPRYFLVAGIAYLLLVADLAGVAIRKGRALGIAALALLGITLAQEGVYLDHFLATGRGHYRWAVQQMTKDGPATYATNDEFRDGMIVDFFANQLGAKATLVPKAEWCHAPPDWYLVYEFSHAAPPPEVAIGDPACALHYGAPTMYPYWGMSGFQWELYRRIVIPAKAGIQD